MNTRFAKIARTRLLTPEQNGLVIGSMLGDGYLVKTTSGYAFRVNHGLRQTDYVNWKHKKLIDFVNSKPRQSGSTYYFRTISHPKFVELRKLFYKDRTKVIPKKFLETYLDPFVLAVWIMDDGSRDGRQLRINTQCFSSEEHVILQNVLRAKLGIETTLNRDKKQLRLRVREKSMQTLRNLVMPYIIPSMLYKLIP